MEDEDEQMRQALAASLGDRSLVDEDQAIAASIEAHQQPSHWLSDDRTGRMSGAAPAPACAAIEASAPNLVSKAQLPPEVAFPVGSKVDALDVAGTWYEAKLVDERGQGDARELLVHYNGWKARYDEWVGAGSGRVRAAGNGKLGPCKRLAAATKMETGSRVEALDPRGTWYAAAVVDARGTGLSRELLVHYNGWNKRQDEWMGVCSGRLRASGGKLDPSKSVASHEEGDGQHRSASAPKMCAGDAVTAATRAPSAPAPDAIDPTHSQTQEPPACLADQWLGVPTEHFGTLSLGLMRYLGKVAREEDDQVFFWLVIDGNEHCAPRATVREWLLPVGEVANAVKGMLRTSPPKQTCAPVSVPAPAATHDPLDLSVFDEPAREKEGEGERKEEERLQREREEERRRGQEQVRQQRD